MQLLPRLAHGRVVHIASISAPNGSQMIEAADVLGHAWQS